MTGADAIRVTDLTVRLGDKEALRSVSFVVKDGQQLAVIGPNGAGKSTLVRCLDGLVPRVEGHVEIFGHDVTNLARRRLARLVSYVPQADDHGLGYTVGAFVEMGRYPHVRGWASLGEEDRSAVQRAMALTETAHLAERMLSSLSGGERQRVHIAAALAQGGRLLLLDEPTSFLDYRHQVHFADLVNRLRRDRSMTIVTVTHDLNSSIAASDVVLALKAGEVVFCGSPRELYHEHVLSGIFDTSFELVPVPWRDSPMVLATGGAR